MRRRGIIAIDNPFNGYVEGHSDSEDLGIFILSPLAVNLKNGAPVQEHVWLWTEVENTFDPDINEFDTDTQ